MPGRSLAGGQAEVGRSLASSRSFHCYNVPAFGECNRLWAKWISVSETTEFSQLTICYLWRLLIDKTIPGYKSTVVALG